jgi:hypothetical protein
LNEKLLKVMTMANICFRKIRIAGILFMALFLCSCATYPAFQDPNIDYDGRWGTWDGGYGAYTDPSVSLYDETGGPYGWYPYTGSYYHYWNGDDPHRYFQH